MTRWHVAVLMGLVVAALLLTGAAKWATIDGCRNPAFLTRASTGLGYPVPSFDDILRVSGGLPRSNAEFDGSAYEFPHFLRLAAVSTWRILSIDASTTEPIHTRILDDDPTYALVIEIEVDYADGSRGVLRWSRWQYGLLLCPFVVPYGDGPPWTIQYIN